MKLSECGKNFLMKDRHCIKLFLMNLRTPYDVLCSTFHTNWRSRKEDGKDYTFDVFCDLLIKDNRHCLMKGSLVVSIILTCLSERASGTIKRDGIPMFLVRNKNVRTKKLS